MSPPWRWIIISANLVGLIALSFVYPGAMVSPGPLIPAHADLSDDCFACHAPFQGAAADRCEVCHVVEDLGVLTTRGEPVRPDGDPVLASFHAQLTDRDCGVCHTDHGRLSQPQFSHTLLRADTRADCASCHAAPTTDLHRDLGRACADCHTTDAWSPATFDHATLTDDALAACETCHRPPEDPLHAAASTGCPRCHSPAAWSPSTFNHDRAFRLDRDHDASCTTCHREGDFSRYTCFGCHEHTPANIRGEHEEEGIRNYQDCVRCHRSADDEPDEGHGRRSGSRGRDDDD